MFLLLIDFGLVVLIWLVQLVIYPGFTYYAEKDLIRWHDKYTSKITLVVLPLMVSQLGAYVLTTFQDLSFMSLLGLLMVVSTWVLTFFFAVPLHGKITQRVDVMASAEKLVLVNWPRTIIWTLIFVINVISKLN